MKTPDEIRAGLGCCYVLHSCKGCPYDDDGCIPALWEDSVSYIGQLEAGQHRPLQKPLTLKELQALIDAGDEAVIFCETKQDKETTYGTILYHGRIYDRYGEAPGTKHIRYETYGKNWRAWAQRPTDEERAAAPWEAADDADL